MIFFNIRMLIYLINPNKTANQNKLWRNKLKKMIKIEEEEKRKMERKTKKKSK